MSRVSETGRASTVSVVVPVYNAERYLEACIRSVLEQDYPHIELILVNDGSKDGSGNICEAWKQKDERVKYLYHPNAGVSATRNKGLDAATGDYVIFVDSDDELKQHAICKLMECAQSKQCDLILYGYEYVYSNRREQIVLEDCIIESAEQIPSFFFKHYLDGTASSVCTKLYKKDKISHRFCTDLTMGEDLLFNLYYIKQISSLCVVSNVLYEYNQASTDSLVRKYKPIYFEQECIVFSEWLKWGSSLKLKAKDMENVYYRIVSSFLVFMQHVAGHETFRKTLDVCKKRSAPVCDVAVLNVLNRFNVLQRLIIKCIHKGWFVLAVDVIKMYCVLKKCLIYISE